MAHAIDLNIVRLGGLDLSKCSPFEKFCYLGSASKIRELIVNGNYPKERALFFAAGSPDPLVFKLVAAEIKAGCSDPNFNPLNAACASAAAREIVPLLLEEQLDWIKPDENTLFYACASEIESVATLILGLKPPCPLTRLPEILQQAINVGFTLSFLEKVCAEAHTPPGGTFPKDPIEVEIKAQVLRKYFNSGLLFAILNKGWKPSKDLLLFILKQLEGKRINVHHIDFIAKFLGKGQVKLTLEEALPFFRQVPDYEILSNEKQYDPIEYKESLKSWLRDLLCGKEKTTSKSFSDRELKEIV